MKFTLVEPPASEYFKYTSRMRSFYRLSASAAIIHSEKYADLNLPFYGVYGVISKSRVLASISVSITEPSSVLNVM